MIKKGICFLDEMYRTAWGCTQPTWDCCNKKSSFPNHLSFFHISPTEKTLGVLSWLEQSIELGYRHVPRARPRRSVGHSQMASALEHAL